MSDEAAETDARRNAAFARCADAIPAMVRRSDASGEFGYFNPDWLAFTGAAAGEQARAGWLRAVHPEDLEGFLAAFGEAFDARRELTAAYRLRRHDGGYRRVLDRGRPYFAPDGSFQGYVVASIDVEEVRSQTLDRRPVIDEINHRVKNALFSVQAIARQTMWGTAELERAYTRFADRLVAMARTHDLMIEEDWRGASMRSLVRRVAQPYGLEGEDFEMQGEEVRVAPQLTLSLALCLHELFSNAARFGALSEPGGKVAIDWTAAGSRPTARVQLRWRESGVDRSRYPTEVADLGTALIQVLGRDPEEAGDPGLTCLIEFPVLGRGGDPA